MSSISNPRAEVIAMLCLVRILTFKWPYRDGNRFRAILQNEMISHYDRVGAERGKGMFLRMKVSTRVVPVPNQL